MSITAIQSGFGSNGTITTTSNPSLAGGQATLGHGSTSGYITTTPYYPTHTQTFPYFGGAVDAQPDVGLRKVENGWILKMHNKEYVLTETAQVAKYLQLFEEAK